MDVATPWEWFEEVFHPEVRKRIGRPVLFLMDNAPGHFQRLKEITSKWCSFHLTALAGNSLMMWELYPHEKKV